MAPTTLPTTSPRLPSMAHSPLLEHVHNISIHESDGCTALILQRTLLPAQEMNNHYVRLASSDYRGLLFRIKSRPLKDYIKLAIEYCRMIPAERDLECREEMCEGLDRVESVISSLVRTDLPVQELETREKDLREMAEKRYLLEYAAYLPPGFNLPALTTTDRGLGWVGWNELGTRQSGS